MKREIILAAFIALLLVSCAKNEAPVNIAPTAIDEATAINESTTVNEEAAPEEKPATQQIAPEVQELLSLSKTKVKSAYYKYRGPETGNNFFEFYIRGPRIKYKPALEIKALDKPESYDSIFIDKSAGTAASYCEPLYCAVRGKKQDLNYENAYIDTIFDWIKVEQAVKVGEEVIDSRSTWKLETEKGFVWVDSFYGIPLKAESDGVIYRFEQIAVNSVQDSDVTPSS